MKKTLSALVGSLIGNGLLLTIAAVYPEIPTTDYTFGFMTNETAASARTYLGFPSGGILPNTMVGTNLTAGTLAFVGTYKTNLIDGPAITSAGSNFVILANTNAMLAYLGINNIVVTNRGNGVPLLDTNDNSTIWLKSVTNSDGSITITDNSTNIDFKMSGLYKGSLAVTNAVTANTVVATNGGTLGPITTSGTNATLTGSFSANTVTGTNGLTPGSFTVATLPASAPTGTVLYCSDAVTVAGTGGIVWYDGAVWRTKRNNIQATADVLTYILRCYGAQVNDSSPISYILIASSEIQAAATPIPGGSGTSGTGSGVGPGSAIDAVVGSYGQWQSGTAADSAARRYGPAFRALATGDYYACGGNYILSDLCDGTDKYFVTTGWDGTSSSNYVASGSYFLYDMYNITGHGLTYTNNWICVNAKASTREYADSGLPASTSVWNRLVVLTTTTGATFYTNGVACASLSNPASIPAVAMYALKTQIYRTAGSNQRYLRESFAMIHVRRATAITLP